MPRLLVAALLLVGLEGGRSLQRPRHLPRSSRRGLFDHFIDCQQFPEIGALYGLGSAACLGGQSGLAYLLGGGLAQLGSFALLLASYYAFKRGTSLLSDLGVSEEERAGDATCPKCNGSGVFTWRGEPEECDLCDGSGQAPRPGRSPLRLPRRAGREDLREDEEDS